MIDLNTFIKQVSAIVPPKWGIDPDSCTPKQAISWCKRLQSRCRNEVEALWLTYNTGRANLSTRTVANARSVSAYLIGFHPFQWLRAQQVLSRAQTRHPAVFERFKEGYDCIDLGCGTGALSSAAEDVLGPAERWLGVDLSKPALKAAEIGSRAKQKKSLKVSLHDLDFERYLANDTRPLLICLGYTANEMRGTVGERFRSNLLNCIANLKEKRPVLLIWLEPAMEEQAIYMHKVKEQARLLELPVLYPCPHQATCPMGTGESVKQKDRCYSEVSVEGSKKIPAVLLPGAPKATHNRSRLGVSGYVFWNQHGCEDEIKKLEGGILVGRPRERNGAEKMLICKPDGEIRKKPGRSEKMRGQTLA